MLLLASRSPQRRAILDQLGIAYEALPVDVEELGVGDPLEVARHNAVLKARAAAELRPEADLILGVDTLVALDGEIFGKPADAGHAAETIARLAGRTHHVHSGLALIRGGELRASTDSTGVTFRTLDEEAVQAYVATGEWEGRAGGYAIQLRGAALVRRIEGDYLNVVGLPVAAFLDAEPGLTHHSR